MKKINIFKKIKENYEGKISIDYLRVYPYFDGDNTTYKICEWLGREKINENTYLTKIKVISTNEILIKKTITAENYSEYSHDVNCKYYLEGKKSLEEMLEFLELPTQKYYTVEQLAIVERVINNNYRLKCSPLKKVLKI